MIKKHKDEIVFTQTELAELYIMRTMKVQKELSKQQLLETVKIKYNIDTDLIGKILIDLVDKTYLSIDNNNYLYVI